MDRGVGASSGSCTHATTPPVPKNGSDTDGYHGYYICFYIFSRIRIVSAMPDMILFDVDIINMRFKFSNTDAVSDDEYPDLDTNRSKLL